LSYVSTNQGWSQPVSEFSWDNKFVGAQILLAKAYNYSYIFFAFLFPSPKKEKLSKIDSVIYQEFYGGKKDLTKFKSDAESFICAVMPGSSSLQIKTTPGKKITTYY
jgi:hypothetical protein